MGSTGLKNFLQDTDSLVVIEAARAIHDDQSVQEALPALSEALLTQKITDEAFVRRAINANLRLGDSASANRLKKGLSGQCRYLSSRYILLLGPCDIRRLPRISSDPLCRALHYN